MKVIEYKQIECICLFAPKISSCNNALRRKITSLEINKVRPIIPEAREIDRLDKISADALLSNVSYRKGTDTFSRGKITIQNPFKKEAIASDATNIGITAATTAD